MNKTQFLQHYFQPVTVGFVHTLHHRKATAQQQGCRRGGGAKREGSWSRPSRGDRQSQVPRPVPVRSTMLSDKVQTWGTCLQGSVSWPGGRGITWDLCVVLFFLFLGICIFTALIIWNLLEMITTLRIDQQLTQTGYNQTNASLVNKSLNV